VDSAGHPLAGVEIYVQPRDEFPPGNVEAVTDAAGHFSLPVVDSGSRLRARKGKWSTIKPVTPGAQELTITLVENAQAAIRIVVHQPDGAPLAGANVELSDGRFSPANRSMRPRSSLPRRTALSPAWWSMRPAIPWPTCKST
jgi:hypothetical protein